MITLREAFKLCNIEDSEVLWLCDRLEGANFWSWPVTGREVREKFDMRNTMVTAIENKFHFSEWEGFLFIIKKGGETGENCS